MTPALAFEPRVPPPATDRVDLRLLFAVFRRRLGVFLAVFLAVLGAGLVLTALQPRTYTARAEVTLNSRPQSVAPTSASDGPQQSAIPSEGYVDTQVAVVTSEANLAAVAESLGLAREARFAKSADGGRTAALAWLRKGVVATRIGSTYGIAITFEDADPALAARVANTFAQQYTAGALDAKRRTARATTTTIAERLEQLRQQALADTAAVQRYRIANNLLSTTMGTLTEQEISSYNQEVTTARAEASEDGARLDAARRQLALGGSAGGVGEVAVSPRAAGDGGDRTCLPYRTLWPTASRRAAREGRAGRDRRTDFR